MSRFTLFARALIVTAALLALVPLARIGYDWMQVRRLGVPSVGETGRGFGWVVWNEEDGLIIVEYVFRRGRHHQTALQEGDVFYEMDYQQYFNLEDLQRAIEGIPPGSTRTFSVLRGDQMVEASVQFSRYPTFLYPLSTPLWHFSVWGFLCGAFLHLIGLIIAVPLALRSRQAQFSLLLVGVASLWMFGNLLRLLLIEFFGPSLPGTSVDQAFRALTLVGLAGWIGFPALLLHKVATDARRVGGARIGLMHFGVYVPALILGAAALAATLGGRFGPFTLDSLAAPILFYACVYIAAAAALVLALYVVRPDQAEDYVGRWSKPGSAFTLVAALLFGLSVLGVVPLFGAVNDTMAGWLIVAAQLLFVAPVALVAHASLKHGKVDQVVTRALTYLTVLGLIFLTFVGGIALLGPILDRLGPSRTLVEGAYVVVLLLVFERLARRVRLYAGRFFATDRQRARQHLSRFQERMHTILDYDALVRATVEAIGEGLQVRSARLFVRPPGRSGPWISHPYHPEPPFLTEGVILRLWPYFQHEGTVWARNPELNESTLPPDMVDLLVQRRSILAIPILGDGEAVGLLVLGEKRERRSVYTLEDLDMLRSLGGQLALAVERLNLIERERELVRQSAEAQLTALRAQINPHFLFNALNTVVSLIEEQPEEAVAVVEHLAAIFRHILHTGGQAFVTVQEEFALIGHYLSIEQARFGERLVIEQQLHPALRALSVPAFAVQTLVENAVKHGLEQRRDGGRLRLSCRPVDTEMAEIVVADTGVGIPALFGKGEQVVAEAPFLGIGLRNIAARLERHYGRTDLLRMTSDPAAGTVVRLLLPLEAPFAPTGDGAAQWTISQEL